MSKRLSEAVVNDKSFKLNGKTIDKSERVSDETKENVKTTNSKEKEEIKNTKPTEYAPIENIDYHDENNLPSEGDVVNKINKDDGKLIPSSYKELQADKDKEEINDDEYYEKLSNNEITSTQVTVTNDNSTDESYYDNNTETNTNSYGTYYSKDNTSNSESTSKPYNKPINVPEPEKGKVNIWFQGTLVGQEDYVLLNKEFCNRGKILVVKKYYEPLMRMLLAAKQDGVILKLNDGYRSYEQQLDIRRRFLKDNYKSDPDVNNDTFLGSTKAAPQSTYFKPLVAPPGYGFHHYGISFDIQCKGGGLQPNDSYKWLLKNAFTYGFIRTVASEDWHWEYKPWNEPKIKNFYKLNPPYSPYSVIPNNESGWAWNLKPIDKQSNA